MRGVCERHAKDLEHFKGTSIQPHVMLYNRNQAVGIETEDINIHNSWKTL